MDDATCQDSVGPRNDKTCEACGSKYGSQEEPKHPSLCPYCAATMDRFTERKLERDHYDWFGE
jgi:hypothetical protein